MHKKYELTDETQEWNGRTLHRIRALADFDDVKAGDLGGWIEKEENLSHNDNAWVCVNAWVFGNAQVFGDARVCGNAQVFGDAWVFGNAQVFGDARVFGNAQVFGDAWVFGDARVFGNARVCGNAEICKTSDYFTSGPIGSRDDTITFFRCKDGKIRATTGCFYGDLDQLEAAVRSKHKNNNYAQAYMGVIAAAKAQMGADQNV